jgi:hypothetical protein
LRIITLTIGGAPTPGDVVNIGYAAKRGGKTETGHLVKDGEKLPDIARGLAFGINTHFCQPLFEAKAKDTVVMIICAEGVDDVTFHGFIEHVAGSNSTMREAGGTETVTISE